MFEGYGLYRIDRKKEHEQRIADITREFITSKYLKGFYNEVLKDTDKDIFENGGTLGGIGEGRYYPTIRECIEDALYQLFEQDWKQIREHTELYEYIADTVSQRLQDEALHMDNFEDCIEYKWGAKVIVSVDLDDILEDLRKEMEKTMIDEMIELFVTAVNQCPPKGM